MIYPTAKQRVQVLFVLPTNAARCWELENVWLAMAQLSSLDFKTNRHWSSSREALPWVLPRAKVKLPKAAKTKEKVPRLLAKALVSARKPQLSLSLNFDLCRSSESWHQKNRLEIEALEVMRSHENSRYSIRMSCFVCLCPAAPRQRWQGQDPKGLSRQQSITKGQAIPKHRTILQAGVVLKGSDLIFRFILLSMSILAQAQLIQYSPGNARLLCYDSSWSHLLPMQGWGTPCSFLSQLTLLPQ